MKIAILVALSACAIYEPTHMPLCEGDYLQTGIDPDTGACESYGDECGPTAGIHVQWAACHGSCDQLGESACLATAACHAEYVTATTFAACWNTVPTVAHDGRCSDLVDAWNCAAHDNCASLLISGRFASCIDEPLR
jgi:hypothetical protein